MGHICDLRALPREVLPGCLMQSANLSFLPLHPEGDFFCPERPTSPPRPCGYACRRTRCLFSPHLLLSPCRYLAAFDPHSVISCPSPSRFKPYCLCSPLLFPCRYLVTSIFYLICCSIRLKSLALHFALKAPSQTLFRPACSQSRIRIHPRRCLAAFDPHSVISCPPPSRFKPYCLCSPLPFPCRYLAASIFYLICCSIRLKSLALHFTLKAPSQTLFRPAPSQSRIRIHPPLIPRRF